MVTFFNDVNVAGDEKWIPAVQYFGTKGFFHDYNARMGVALKLATGKAWPDGFAKLLKGELDPNALAHAVAEAEHSGGKEMTEAEFTKLPPASLKTRPLKSRSVISRAAAMSLMFSLLP
jgi:hypothetical protein